MNAPTGLAAAVQSGPSIVLSWNDTATDESGFVLERSVNGGVFAALATRPARTGTGAMTYTDAEVMPGGSYAYRVKAMNGIVSSTWCESATVAVSEIPAAPVLSFRVKRGGATDKVTLRWADVTAETGYLIGRAANSDFAGDLTFMDIAADVTSAINDFAHGSSYFYLIQASNQSGTSAWSAPIMVGTSPAAPKNVRVKARTHTSITVAWKDTSRNEKGYCIQRRRPTGAWKTAKKTGQNVTSWKNMGLVRDRAYQYRIRGFNATGSSAWSKALKTTMLR